MDVRGTIACSLSFCHDALKLPTINDVYHIQIQLTARAAHYNPPNVRPKCSERGDGDGSISNASDKCALECIRLRNACYI